MKKFLIIFLSCILLLTFGFSASAETVSFVSPTAESSYVINGDYQFKSRIDYSSVSSGTLTRFDVSFSVDGVTYNQMRVEKTADNIEYVNTSTGVTLVARSFGAWVKSSYRKLTFNSVSVSSEFYNFFMYNVDTLNTEDVYSYNGLLLLDVQNDYKLAYENRDKYYWFIYYNSTNGLSYLYKSSIPIVYNSSTGYYIFSGVGNIEIYNLTATGVTWVETSSVSNSNSLTSNTAELYWSSHDVTDIEGNKVFNGDSWYAAIRSSVDHVPSEDEDVDENANFFTKIGNFLSSIWNSLKNLPISIANALKNLFQSVVNSITNLSTSILNGIKNIFIPDTEELKAEISNLVNSLSPTVSAGPGGGSDGGNVNFQGGSAESLFPNPEGSSPLDVYEDLDFGSLHLDNVKLVDYSALVTAVDFFRPIINGFLVFLLGLYWYREVLSFIGQAPNMASAQKSAEEHQSKGGKKP